MTVVMMDHWAEATRDGLIEVAQTMGLPLRVGDVSAEVPAGAGGSYISLASPDNAVQLAVVSDDGGCRSIAARLLGLELPEASELSQADVADGVGELVNVMAGVMKTLVQGVDSSLQVGLPMFLAGEVRPGNHLSVRSVAWTLGSSAGAAVLYLHAPRRSLAAAR